jgi:NAD(P)-dependent dehydrogenase (short-subunit alcohol dehydrogenase family)
MEIKGKSAIVTGGASGLGAATAKMLLGEGAAGVVLLDIDLHGTGDKVSSELGDKAVFIKGDVADEEPAQKAVDEALKLGPLYIVVNCAGVGTASKVVGKKGPVSLDFFKEVVNTNLIGTFNVIRLAAAKMMTNDPVGDDGERGIFINVASIAAYEGQLGQVAYSASKNGVVGITIQLAREFAANGIRVMTIAPGIFDTPMLAALPDKVKESLGKMVPYPPRLGKPVEFAGLSKHIIENSYLNGYVIRLDGAIRMAAK